MHAKTRGLQGFARPSATLAPASAERLHPTPPTASASTLPSLAGHAVRGECSWISRGASPRSHDCAGHAAWSIGELEV